MKFLRCLHDLRYSQYLWLKTWLYEPQINLGFKLNEANKNQKYVAEVFGLSKHTMDWKIILSLMFLGFVPKLLVSILQTIIQLSGNEIGLEPFLLHYRTWAEGLYEFGYGVIVSVALAWYYRAQFWISGAWILFAHAFWIRGFHLIRYVWVGFGSVSFLVVMLYYVALILLALILVPDLRRSFGLLFYFRHELDIKYAGSKKLPYGRDLVLQLAIHRNILKFLAILGIGVLLFALALSVSVGGSRLSNLISSVNANQTTVNNMLQTSNVLNLVLIYALVIVVAPILEEFAYRTAIISGGNNSWASVVLSGFIFGLVHVSTSPITVMFSYLFFGLVLAIFYRYFGNVWVCVLVHFGNNLLSVII